MIAITRNTKAAISNGLILQDSSKNMLLDVINLHSCLPDYIKEKIIALLTKSSNAPK